MKFIDTHTHIYLKEFDSDLEDVVQRAKKNNHCLLLPHIDQAVNARINKLVISHPAFCLPMIGLHPCSVPNNNIEYKKHLSFIESELTNNHYVAIGETGLDLYWDKNNLNAQIHSLKDHIAWAKSLKKPIVLHTREALVQTLEIVEQNQDGCLTGVYHCFGARDESELKRALDTGLYLGIGGVITYKNTNLRDLLKSVPKDKVVLETDSPYLAPLPHRGKRNESSYIEIIARKLAEVWGESVETVAQITNTNAIRLFNLQLTLI